MDRLPVFLGIFWGGLFPAQEDIVEQIKELKEKSDKLNVFINFQSTLETEINQEIANTSFKGKMFRIEMRGNLTPKIFYRVRYRMNKVANTTSLDHLSDAADMMLAGYRINDRFAISLGKMGQNWGGFEYDLNPMNIYDYSDYVNNIEAFLVGGFLYYQHNKNHDFSLNINNISSKILEERYGKNIALEQSKIPLGYVFTWAGKFNEGKIQTRWSLGYHQITQNHASKMLILGTKFFFPKWNFFVDYSFAQEDLDRLRYASASYNPSLHTPNPFQNVHYHSLVSRIEYKPNERWTYSLQGMLEKSRIHQTLPESIKDNQRLGIGYFTGVEFFPFKEQNLRFYAIYMNRNYHFKHQADEQTHNFSLGIMYRIKAF